MMDPKDVGEWQHEEFYRYVAQAHDKPRYTLHYRTDAPLNIRSIFYVPDTVRPGGVGQGLPVLVCCSLGWGPPPWRQHFPVPVALALNGDRSAQTSQKLTW